MNDTDKTELTVKVLTLGNMTKQCKNTMGLHVTVDYVFPNLSVNLNLYVLSLAQCERICKNLPGLHEY